VRAKAMTLQVNEVVTRGLSAYSWHETNVFVWEKYRGSRQRMVCGGVYSVVERWLS